MDGYWVIMGTLTDRITHPPTELQGAFLVEPALLDGSGASGNLKRFSGDDFLIFACSVRRAP
jgi:hypothetical protein